MENTPTKPRLGIIGFGEVGRIFAQQLQATGAFKTIHCWDIKLAAPDTAQAERLSAQTRLSY
jgi:prephenate dehydrogenase